MEFKDIVKEWYEQFPILSKYTPTTLFAKAGIVLIGLRLERDHYDYRVFLEILPLWVPKEKIIIPVFEQETRNEKGLQVFIDIKLHDPLLLDYVEAQTKRGAEIDLMKFEIQRSTRRKIIDHAMECVHKQFDAILQEYVSLGDIFRLINNHTSSIVFDRNNPLDWYRLFELKLALAYHFNREDLILKVKREIEKEVRNWTQERFNVLFRVSKEEWKAELYRRMENRDAFMRQVELNLSLKKISKLKQIHIHDDMERGNSLLQKFGNFLRSNK
ncbi:MAG: hypothetical protein K2L17_08920 [Muribaculaceae bacterium]|nr:hypothetical protein [Muribaculaceae bacterium]MDE6787537.1 hypothetical protein [Muribaculaceae bacterium]